MKLLPKSQGIGCPIPFKFDLKMRLAILCLLLPLLGMHAKTSYAQKTISLDVKGTTVLSILEDIEKNTDYRFVYKIEDVNLTRLLDLNVEKKRVPTVLDKIFKSTDVDYKILGNQVFLNKRKGFSFKAPPVLVERAVQQIEITGTVTDEAGVPIPGVNVTVEGTPRGTSTDFDGNYSIEAEEGEVLNFSSIGFEDQSITIGSDLNIDIVMKEGQALDEVVVVGYGSSTQRDLTGSVGSVSSKDIEKFPSSSVASALQGKAAGVQITQNSGAPGSEFSINIRGIGSFGNNEPLYVVDGYPLEDISFLNTNDIESISVLKDASAAAIYGVRASAGVVIIETKKGARNKISIDVNSWVGFELKPTKIDMLNVDEFTDLALEIANNQNKDVLDEWSHPENLRNIDWQKYAFKTGLKQGHNISIRGGGERARASLSVGMVDEDGIVRTSSYKRYNIALNTEFDVNENITARSNLKYAYSENYNNLSQGFYGFAKIFGNVPYLDDRTGTDKPYDGEGNYGAFPNSSLVETSQNVIGNAMQRDNDNGNNNILGSLSLDYRFLDGFKLTGKFGFHTQNYAGWSFLPKYNRGTANNDNNPSSTYDINQNTSNEFLFEGLFEYKKTFNDHKIDALLGYSIQRNKFKNVDVQSRGFLSDGIRDLAAADEITNRSGTWGTSTLIGTFGRVNYTFKNRYNFSATIRRDGVGNKFSRNNLYGTFPSVAVGWNIDEESFMRNTIFDLLKLRGSWGETGNSEGISPFRYLTSYSAGPTNDDNGYVFNGKPQSGLAPSSLGNPDLKWESQVQTNVGIDVELLSNSLYLTADYFQKSAKDFLLEENMPSQVGFTSRPVNAGNIKNRGFEVLVGYRKVQGDFKWDLSVNFTKINNKITQLTRGQNYLIFDSNFAKDFVDDWVGLTRSFVGYSVGTFYGYRTDGIFQTQEEIDKLNSQSPDGLYQESTGSEPVSPGDRKFVDLNNDGKITAADREVIGNPFPDFYGGLDFNASYKNFEIGISIYGSYGNDILNYTRVEQETAGGFGLNNAYSNVSKEYYNNRWTPENNSNKYARALVEDGNHNNRVSDHFVEDGSFLRLRNVQLAYNFSHNLIEPIGLTNAKVYVSGQNLITLTGYNGMDPEIGKVSDIDGKSGVQTRGLDFGAYPSPRMFTVGINLQF